MPGNKLLPFLRDISQMTAILPFFPSPSKYQVPRTGQLFGRTDTRSSLFCQQPGNFRRKPWSHLAYGYQSDSKAKTFRNIKAACVKMSHRSSKLCTAHHCLNRHHFQPHHKLSTEAQGLGDGCTQKTTVKGLLMFNFHHLCMPPLRGAATAAVWAGGEGDALGRGCAGAAANPARCLRQQHWHQLQELSLPAPLQVQVPGKTACGPWSCTDEIGPGWEEQRRPKSGERRQQLKNGMGPGLSPVQLQSPRPSLRSALMVAGSHHRQAWKACQSKKQGCLLSWHLQFAQNKSHRYKINCRLFSYWHILDLEIYFPFPTNCARGFRISAKKKSEEIPVSEEHEEFIHCSCQNVFVLVWLALQKNCSICFRMEKKKPTQDT